MIKIANNLLNMIVKQAQQAAPPANWPGHAFKDPSQMSNIMRDTVGALTGVDSGGILGGGQTPVHFPVRVLPGGRQQIDISGAPASQTPEVNLGKLQLAEDTPANRRAIEQAAGFKGRKVNPGAEQLDPTLNAPNKGIR